MKLSVMLFPFHKDLSDKVLEPKNLVQEFRAVGITAIEPMMSWLDADPIRWTELRKAADDLGMKYSCFDVGVNFVGESAADRQKAQDIVARGVQICVDLKCPVALLPGTKPAANMSNEEGRKIYAEELAKAAERAKGSGVTLTIEDFGVYPFFACSIEHVLEVLDGTKRDDVKLTFDNGNFLLADESPAACFKRCADRIVHVHIKDFALQPADATMGIKSREGKRYIGCEIGTGMAEVKECLALIKASKYDGWLSLEVGTRPPLDAAIRGAKYVREVWERL